MFYDANIGERCETERTWFDRGESTNYTDYTDYFLANENYFCQRIIRTTRSFSLVNRLHWLHRLFSYQRKLFLPTDNTDNTKIFFSQQITLITQKKNSCSSCYPLAKEKNQCNPCNLLTKTKTSCSSCYPLAKEKNQCNLCNPLTKKTKSPAILTDGRAWQKSLFPSVNQTFQSNYIACCFLPTSRSRTICWQRAYRSWLRSQSPCPRH